MTDTGSEPAVVFLMGATASGKTELAVELAQRLPCEIVSVDSAMVYRGMDIGTAKPSDEELSRAPHRLIDILDPAGAYSAARFREDALREIGEIVARGRIPLLAGGTMLYFRALERGLAQLPAADPQVRARIDAEAASVGWEALHRRLAAVDPQAAERIHPNDPQRLQRALEVYELTGRPLSEFIAAQIPEPFPYRVVKIILVPADRELLRERIAVRFHEMLAQGFLAEVEALHRRGDLDPEKPAIRCVGYRQAWSYLEGEWDYSTMVERAITATRQLAKRQFTWLRCERESPWFESGDRRLLDKVLKYLNATTI